MSQAIKRSDVIVRVDDNRGITVNFKDFPLANVNKLGRINGKRYDFQEIGMSAAIGEFCHCVRSTVEHVSYARMLTGSIVAISTKAPEEANHIADQVRSLLRLQGLSVT